MMIFLEKVLGEGKFFEFIWVEYEVMFKCNGVILMSG